MTGVDQHRQDRAGGQEGEGQEDLNKTGGREGTGSSWMAG